MKVYLVSHGQHDDEQVAGIFSTREAAEAYMNADGLAQVEAEHPGATHLAHGGHHLNQDRWDFNEIQEFELDSLPPTQWVFKTYGEMYGADSTPREGYPTQFIGPAAAFEE